MIELDSIELDLINIAYWIGQNWIQLNQTDVDVDFDEDLDLDEIDGLDSFDKTGLDWIRLDQIGLDLDQSIRVDWIRFRTMGKMMF